MFKWSACSQSTLILGVRITLSLEFSLLFQIVGKKHKEVEDDPCKEKLTTKMTGGRFKPNKERLGLELLVTIAESNH